MRFPLAILLSAALPAAAQSPSRDWRPEDRTIIGDFSRITAVATSFDKVYVTSTTSLVIWNPQFRTWAGPYEPPDRGLLTGVFTALVDPLDQTLWLATGNGWLHYQPELRIWDQGRVPDAVVSIAFDENDPISGLYIRTRGGWFLVPRGGMVRDAGASARPTDSPALGRRGAAPGADAPDQRRPVPDGLAHAPRAAHRRRPRRRQSGLVPRHFGARPASSSRTPAAIPERMPFGLPAQFVGAVMSWPGGIWAATNRSTLSRRGLHLRGRPASRVQDGARSPRHRHAVQPRARAGRAGPVALGRDRLRPRAGGPVGGAHRAVGRRARSARQPGVRRGGPAGTDRGRHRARARADGRLAADRSASRRSSRDAAYAVFPAGDSIWVGTPRGVLLALPGQDDLVRPRHPRLRQPAGAGLRLRDLGDTLVALTRDQHDLAQPDGRRRGPSAPISPACSAGCGASPRTGPASGSRASGASASRGSARRPRCAAPRGRPSRSRQRSRRGPRPPLGRAPRPAWSASASTPSVRDPALPRPIQAPRSDPARSSIASARSPAPSAIVRARLGDDCALLPLADGALCALHRRQRRGRALPARLDRARGGRLARRGRRALRPGGRGRRGRRRALGRHGSRRASPSAMLTAIAGGIGDAAAVGRRRGASVATCRRARRGASRSP